MLKECEKCGKKLQKHTKRSIRCSDRVNCGAVYQINPKFKLSPIDEKQEENNRFGYDIEAATKRADYIRKRFENGQNNFIVVSAQNNTKVFRGFFNSLLKFCKHNDAELIVIASHYKNLTAISKDEPKQWSRDVVPYIVHGDLILDSVVIKSSFKINATTLHPLNGKQAHGRGKWAIFGHPQQAMEPVATPGDMMPLRLYTTGSCTRENYGVSDIGEKAKFNHTFGALTVNFKGHKYPFIRQLNADKTGAFYDLDSRYTSTKITHGHRIECLVPGDEHVKFNQASAATYTADDSIVKLLKPKRIFRHDVLDGYAGSHHHERDPVLRFKKFHNNDDDFRAELDQVVDFINSTTPRGATSYIVPSNHDEHLTKWLARVDTNTDHKNALFALEMQHAQRVNALNGGPSDPLRIYLEPRLRVPCVFLDRSKCFIVDGVDQSQHGDVGKNGSRGSAKAFAATAFKMNIGHSHGARIVGGVFQSGTSTGRLEYERGLGDHSMTHIIQYKGGKRSHVDIYGDRWF